MRFLKNSSIMLAALFCTSFSNGLNAEILWEKELALDANTNSAPLASCLNKDGNGVAVMTVECPKGTFPTKGNNILWEIDSNGNTNRIVPKNIDGSNVLTSAIPVGPGCAVASDRLGNLLTVGILNKQKDEKGQKIAVISKADNAEKIISHYNSIESHSAKKMIPLRDNTFILVGDKNGDGLFLQFDNQGRIIQEKLFDRGQGEIFTDVDELKPDSQNLSIVGISFKISIKDPNENSVENFVLICDPNCEMVHEDYFAAEKSVSAFSLLLQPKVCCLENGNIVVLYRKESTQSNKTLLLARCYTKELELLWEKEIFAADKSPNKSPFYFDVTSNGSKCFVAAILIPVDGLEFYFFNDAGDKVGYNQYKSMVGTPGFNIMRINGRTIAVFKEFSGQGNIKEIAIKAKVLALD